MIPNDLNDAFSLGTGPVMNTLLHVLNEYGEPPDTVVINVDTIVRNCGSNEGINETKKFERENNLEPGRSLRRLLGYAQKEINTVLQDIVDMYGELPRIINPAIILYVGNYTPFIPVIQRRPIAPSKQIFTLASQQLQSAVKVKMDQKLGRIKIIQLPKDDTQLPYKALAKEINSLQNGHRVVMLSHHPLDYHLVRHCEDFMMIKSFTGEALESGDIPERVFGTNIFPFNAVTHAVLGDKEDVLPTLKFKEKKALSSIATKEAWMCLLEDEILKRCSDLGIVVPFKI